MPAAHFSKTILKGFSLVFTAEWRWVALKAQPSAHSHTVAAQQLCTAYCEMASPEK